MCPLCGPCNRDAMGCLSSNLFSVRASHSEKQETPSRADKPSGRCAYFLGVDNPILNSPPWLGQVVDGHDRVALERLQPPLAGMATREGRAGFVL